MENTISLTVKLCGGEALYITPVSYDWSGEDNKFHIYPTIEFLPNISEILRRSSYENHLHNFQLWRFRLTKLARTAKVVAEIFLDNFPRFTGANVFHPWFKNITWEWWDSYLVSKELSHDWFYAVDVFQPDELLHLRGNIEVDWSNVSKYIAWDFSYLSPSSLWVEERLKEEFHVWTYDKEKDKIAEKKFWKWKQEQIDKGYEVFYITSLET